MPLIEIRETNNAAENTSFTAAGCYLCAAPGSKGTKVLVCLSKNCALPLEMQLLYSDPCEGQKCCTCSEVEQLLEHVESYSDKMILNASEVPFLDTTSSASLLEEAKRLGMLSESTHKATRLRQNSRASKVLLHNHRPKPWSRSA